MKIVNIKLISENSRQGRVFGTLLFVMAVFLMSATTTLQAQKSIDLDPATIEAFENVITTQMISLREELKNTPPGVSVESNEAIIEYYSTVLTTFLGGEIELNEAFSNHVYLISPVRNPNTTLAQSLFYSNRNEIPASRLQGSTLGTSASINSATQMVHISAVETFYVQLNNIDISSGSMNSVNAVFNTIRNNK